MGGCLGQPGGPGAVGAVDLGVHWQVVVARGEDPVCGRMRGKYVVFWTSFCNAIWQKERSLLNFPMT